MNLVRAFFLRNRALAIVLVLATLCMKAIVPTGFMIGQNSKVLTVQICDDAFGNHAVKQIAIPMKDGSSDSSGKQGKGPDIDAIDSEVKGHSPLPCLPLESLELVITRSSKSPFR